MIIDRKLEFTAVNPCTHNIYTPKNALVFAAKDAALIPALEAYLQECQNLGCNQEHLDSIRLLIGRVRHFQEHIEKRLPDTTGKCEVARCLKKGR